MVSIRFTSVLAATSLLLTSAYAATATTDTPTSTIRKPITTPSILVPANALVEIGCFSSGVPLENHGPYLYRSPGNCQLVCLAEGKNVMGLSDGENCWCGDELPAKEWIVDNSTCDTPCRGEKTIHCGGPNLLWVELTGLTPNRIEHFKPESSSKKPSATSTSAVPVSTSSTPSAVAKEESKPNTAGIAAGVVVGIVGLAAIIGGVWFFLRRRNQKKAEEDYRRNAANVDQFVSGGKLHTSNSSMNDSRIDPSFMDRRQSNGSIADNEDYSRRILKVTNV